MLSRILLLICVILWGWSFVATKVCLQYLDPFELMGLRLVIAMPLMVAIAISKRVKFRFARADARGLVLGSILLTVHFLIQVTGLKYTSATNTGWIISISPLVMAVLAVWLLKEKLSKRTVVGIVVATLGILFLMSRGDVSNLDWLRGIGDWLVLASAHTWALYTVAVRDVTRARPPLAVTITVLLPCTLICVGYILINSEWSTFMAMPPDGWLALVYLGIFAMALAHWFWQESVSRVGAARAGIYLYLEPIATTALAVPYLGEKFGIFAAMGAALVLFGVWWSERKPRRGLQ